MEKRLDLKLHFLLPCKRLPPKRLPPEGGCSNAAVTPFAASPGSTLAPALNLLGLSSCCSADIVAAELPSKNFPLLLAIINCTWVGFIVIFHSYAILIIEEKTIIGMPRPWGPVRFAGRKGCSFTGDPVVKARHLDLLPTVSPHCPGSFWFN